MKQIFKIFYKKLDFLKNILNFFRNSTLAHYFLLFFSINFIIRLIFCTLNYNQIEHSLSKTFLLGIYSDFITLLYIIPITAIFLCLNSRKILKKTIIFGIFCFFLTTVSTSEILFWNEFKSRFNFIAVDYLVYTHEVWQNVTESYNLLQIFSIIFTISAILSYAYYKKLKNYNKQKDQKSKSAPLHPLISLNYKHVLLSLICPVYAYFITYIPNMQNNRFNTEISKNGLYELFSAYFNNTLDFEKFYVTKEQKVLTHKLRNCITNLGNEPFAYYNDENILREVINTQKNENSNFYNVVIIVVESLSAEFLGYFGCKRNLTPNIDRLILDSIIFSNIKATGTRTVYGLNAIALSQPPIPGNAIIRRGGCENTRTLGTIFKENGYDISFIYGGISYFDNMYNFFNGTGHRVIDRTSFTDDEITFSNVWGVCDENLYDKAIKEFDKSFENKKKFFSIIMTTSNHRPFTFPLNKVNAGFSRDGAVKYTDFAIGQFINQSKWKKWFKDTVFVIIADHTADSAGKILLDPQKYHIPCIIFSEKFKPYTCNKLASQIDLAPTLLGLLKINYKSTFMGHNILKSDYERAFISNYQNIGYMNRENLIIFKPMKKVEMYKNIGTNYLKDENGQFIKDGSGNLICAGGGIEEMNECGIEDELEGKNYDKNHINEKENDKNKNDDKKNPTFKNVKKTKNKENYYRQYNNNEYYIKMNDCKTTVDDCTLDEKYKNYNSENYKTADEKIISNKEKANNLIKVNINKDEKTEIKMQYEALSYIQSATLWEKWCLK